MGRAPCCEKVGLKKGPWTPEEDQILVSYIRLYGHTSWRALPKDAGLLRCGKSCRLRWTNYLRPDIKRGNFTQEEEETIIKLHEMLGNRWSTIASKLPGRTDNEIKNVWHTHLKKRLPKQNEAETGSITITTPTIVVPTKKRVRKSRALKKSEALKETEGGHGKCLENGPPKKDNINSTRPSSSIKCESLSPQPCTSEISTITSTSASENDNFCEENVGEKEACIEEFPEINDDFWMNILSVEDTTVSTEDLPSISTCHTSTSPNVVADPLCVPESKVYSKEMEFFWYNLLTRSDDFEFSEMM